MTRESRLAYHAVPCIVKVGLEDEPPECLKWNDFNTNKYTLPSEEKQNKNCDSSTDVNCASCRKYHDHQAVLERLHQFAKNKQDWEQFALYLARTRININVRQVHEPQENVQLNLI